MYDLGIASKKIFLRYVVCTLFFAVGIAYTTFVGILTISVISIVVFYSIITIIPRLSIYAYRRLFFSQQKKHIRKQADKLRFIQIKVPKSMASKSSDIEADDHIQTMKQVVEVMNQVYKNLYAIYEETRHNTTFGGNYIGLEISIEKEMISFYMAIPDDFVENVEKFISSFYPGALIDLIAQPKLLEAGKYMAGGTLGLANPTFAPVKTYESFEIDPMDSILSSYSRVTAEERLCLQALICPLGSNVAEKLRSDIDDYKKCKKSRYACMRQDFLKNFGSGEDDAKKDEENNKYNFSQQQIQDMDKKVEDELFHVKLRIFATSPMQGRPERIIADTVRAFHQYNNIGLNNFVYNKADNIQSFAKNVVMRSFFSEGSLPEKIQEENNPMILNIKELSSIIHFPHSRYNRNPRIRRQKFKIIPAPDNTPSEGILLGYNTYAGVKKPIYVKPMDRFRHFYTIGQTGTGKSTMMLAMAQQDIELGNGFCLIDPHGDLCEHLLKYIPKERIDDIIYFDFANIEYPIAFNPFEADTADERDIVTNDMVEMFENMYGKEIFGPRIQDYFRNACLLLMEQPEGGTMPEIMRLFTDEAYLDSKLKHLTDPVVQSRWNKTYKAMGDTQKQEIIPYFQAKFGQFTTGTYVRNVIGQPKSAFNFGKVMQQKKILLCNLSKGLTGEVNSQLIGRMFAIQIKLHALKRASIHEDERVPFFLYVDEFQNYVSQSFESILSEARKYRLGLNIAHQYIEQLKQSGLGGSLDLSKPIFGNIGNQLYLKVGPEDADFLERNVAPEFGKTDLLNMDKFKGIMTLSVDTQPSRPFSLTCTNPYAIPPINSPEKIAIIKQISSLKRGTKRELAEKELYYRVGV